MMEESSTNSSRQFWILADSSEARMVLAARSTTRALPSERLTHANKAMRSEPDPFGSMLMREKINHIQMQLPPHWPFRRSAGRKGYLSRYMLDRVTVYIFTGLSVKGWAIMNGSDIAQDLELLFKQTGFRLMGFGLVILRRYCERREPTTEKV